MLFLSFPSTKIIHIGLVGTSSRNYSIMVSAMEIFPYAKNINIVLGAH